LPDTGVVFRRSGDWVAARTSALGFSLGLGMATLVMPITALAAGYQPAAIGALTAWGAVAQICVRLALPSLLGRIADRYLIAAACASLFATFAVLIEASLPAFVIAQALLGTARALFWTASQTHAVRTGASAVRELANLSVIGNVGTMAGPVIAGAAIGVSTHTALAAGCAVALVGALAAFRLPRFAPYQRHRNGEGTALWRQRSVAIACWSACVAGGWRAMLSSFVPVSLSGAGMSTATVGWLLAAADLAGIVANLFLRRRGRVGSHRLLGGAVLATALGLAAIPVVAGSVWLAAAALAISGAGAALISTLSVESGRREAHASAEGDVIALVGTFRAAAIFASPAATSMLLLVVGLPVALAATSIVLAIPALSLLATGRNRHAGPSI